MLVRPLVCTSDDDRRATISTTRRDAYGGPVTLSPHARARVYTSGLRNALANTEFPAINGWLRRGRQHLRPPASTTSPALLLSVPSQPGGAWPPRAAEWSTSLGTRRWPC